jgi:hypothetical protein
LNWSRVRAMARPRFKGFRSTGIATRNVEIGSGSTPRNGPGSIATVAADKPRSTLANPEIVEEIRHHVQSEKVSRGETPRELKPEELEEIKRFGAE